MYSRCGNMGSNRDVVGTDKRSKHFESNLVQFGSFVGHLGAVSNQPAVANVSNMGEYPSVPFHNNSMPAPPVLGIQNPQKIYAPVPVGGDRGNDGSGRHFIPIIGDSDNTMDCDCDSEGGATSVPPPNYPVFNKPHSNGGNSGGGNAAVACSAPSSSSTFASAFSSAFRSGSSTLSRGSPAARQASSTYDSSTPGLILTNQRCHRCVQFKSEFRSCYFCTKLTCGDCAGTCHCCGELFCAGCSVLNYARAALPVTVCLDCNSNRSGNGYGNVYESNFTNSGSWAGSYGGKSHETSHRSTAAFQTMS